MNNNPLPPELLEKYFDLVPDMENYKELQEQCAQIAVDYADEQNAYIIHTFTESMNELRKQRDELIETMRVDNLFLDKWIRLLEVKNWHEEVVQEMKDTLEHNEFLIKKHES